MATYCHTRTNTLMLAIILNMSIANYICYITYTLYYVKSSVMFIKKIFCNADFVKGKYPQMDSASKQLNGL